MAEDKCKKYIFRKIEKEEIPKMFKLILRRIKWMNEKEIKQWNTTKYEEVYPLSYYEEKSEKGELFVLENIFTKEIVSGAVLKEKDNRWQDCTPSFYLHNFVSKLGEKDTGTIFLNFAEKYAVQRGKIFFRLDSAETNKILAEYYKSHGFYQAGKCEEGLYKGILWEKKLLDDWGIKMKIEIREGYNYQKEILKLFTEYTAMLMSKQDNFEEYLKIQNYDEEIKSLEKKYGYPEGRLYIVFVMKNRQAV